jgi:hypothetical protein
MYGCLIMCRVNLIESFAAVRKSECLNANSAELKVFLTVFVGFTLPFLLDTWSYNNGRLCTAITWLYESFGLLW